MARGRITRLVPEHGFGFLVDNAGVDWFFIGEGLRGGSFDAVREGDPVHFSQEWTPKGPRAVDVHAEYPIERPSSL